MDHPNNWRKSSYSTDQANCIEVAWHKSTHSSDTANCVEVAHAGQVVGVRDSKNVGGPVLVVPARGWVDFVRQL